LKGLGAIRAKIGPTSNIDKIMCFSEINTKGHGRIRGILAYVLGMTLKLKEMEEKIVLTFTLVA
jgi:hypothetical protein